VVVPESLLTPVLRVAEPVPRRLGIELYLVDDFGRVRLYEPE
jgi:hypothetical protein